MAKRIEMTRNEASMLRYSVIEAKELSSQAAQWSESAHKKANRILARLRNLKGSAIGIEESDAYAVTDAETLSAMAAVGMLTLWRGVPPNYVVGF